MFPNDLVFSCQGQFVTMKLLNDDVCTGTLSQMPTKYADWVLRDVRITKRDKSEHWTSCLVIRRNLVKFMSLPDSVHQTIKEARSTKPLGNQSGQYKKRVHLKMDDEPDHFDT